eukprot:g75422.t1
MSFIVLKKSQSSPTRGRLSTFACHRDRCDQETSGTPVDHFYFYFCNECEWVLRLLCLQLACTRLDLVLQPTMEEGPSMLDQTCLLCWSDCGGKCHNFRESEAEIVAKERVYMEEQMLMYKQRLQQLGSILFDPSPPSASP